MFSFIRIIETTIIKTMLTIIFVIGIPLTPVLKTLDYSLKIYLKQQIKSFEYLR